MFHCLCSFITFFLQSHYMKVEQSSSVMRLSHSTPTKLDCIRGSETNLRGAAPQPRLPFPEVESPSLSVHLHHQRASLSHVILTCAKSVANSSSNVYTALAQACKATQRGAAFVLKDQAAPTPMGGGKITAYSIQAHCFSR